MRIIIILFALIVALNLNSCKKNELNNSNVETGQEENINPKNQSEYKSKDLLILVDLIGILQDKNIDKNSILEHIRTINNNWKYEGTENEEIIFSKSTNDATKEMLTFHLKYNILEYITFDDEHFFRYIKDFENQNFEITNTSQNEYGGNVSTFTDGKFKVITEEIPLTQSKTPAHKILIALKN